MSKNEIVRLGRDYEKVTATEQHGEIKNSLNTFSGISDHLVDKILFATAGAATFVCASPLIFGIQISNSIDVHNEMLKGKEILEASFVSLSAVAFTLLCDLLSDHYVILTTKKNKLKELHIYERYIFVTSLTFPMVAFYVFRGDANIGDIDLSLSAIRNCWITGCIFSVLSKSATGAWSPNAVCILYILFCINRACHVFSYIFYECLLVQHIIEATGIFAFFCIFVFRYFPAINVYEELAGKTTSECIVLLYAIALSFGGLGQAAADINIRNFRGNNGDARYMAYINFMGMLFCIPLMQIPGRVARSLLASADSKLEAKNSFVRYISHELKFPVNIASLGLHVMKQKLALFPANASELKAELAVLIAEVTESLNTAVGMLNDISTIDKLDSKLMVIDKVPTNIREFVKSSLRIFRSKAKERAILLDLSGCDDPSYSIDILVDVPKLTQVIRNLVSNALKFTHEGGMIQVSLSFITTEKYNSRKWLKFLKGKNKSLGRKVANSTLVLSKFIRIGVKDNGIGMSQEVIDKLFTEDFSSLSKGNGPALGLQISKKFVDLHEGCIGATSGGVNQGSLFYVDIPLEGCATSPAIAMISNKSRAAVVDVLSVIKEETPSEAKVSSVGNAADIGQLDAINEAPQDNIFSDKGDLVGPGSFLGIKKATRIDEAMPEIFF